MFRFYIHKVKLWYASLDVGQKMFFLFFFKVIFAYYFFDTLINLYTGFITPGGSVESDFLIKTDVTTPIMDSIVWLSYHFLDLLQYNVFRHDKVVGIVGTGGVGVGWPCVGISVWMCIAVLVGCFPGKWKIKLGYILFSILCIYIVNVLRICILAILAQYKVDLEDHHIFYNFIIYGLVAILFLIYVEYFSGYKK